MAINLEGILDHDVLISMIGNSLDWIFIYTSNQKCIDDLMGLPFNVCESSKGCYSVCPPVDAVALAERIALSWESDGLKVKRRVQLANSEVLLQSFVLM